MTCWRNFRVLSAPTSRRTASFAWAARSDVARGLGSIPLQLVRLRSRKVLDPSVFLANPFKLVATTIGTLRCDHWQIESFSKSLKQSLRIKTFVGTSATTLKPQIGCR